MGYSERDFEHYERENIFIIVVVEDVDSKSLMPNTQFVTRFVECA